MSDTITITPTLISAPFVDSYTGPSGINDFGTIVVNSANLSYLEYDGTYQRLTAPELGTGTFHAAGINNEGVIVGDYVGTKGEVGVVDDHGVFSVFTTFSVVGGATELTAINDSGEAIGVYGVPESDGDIGQIYGSFIEQDGRITMLQGPLGSYGMYVAGIDDAGEIVGNYTKGNSGYAFSELNGIFSVIDVPGSTSTGVWNISSQGTIIGDYTDASGEHGFIESNGTFKTVDLPDENIYDGFTAINDSGQIAGFEKNLDFGFSAFTAEVTCFCGGTRILTDHGEVPVEALKIGDRVRTLHAGFQPIKWIGTRTYAAPFCNQPKILPMSIAAHAIAENIPARDLYVSPGHAIALEGALIHASRLVNGRTITQLPHAEIVQYFHLELETHEIIFAENTPAETFLGENFRNQFQNAHDFAARYPGDTAPEAHCLPPLARGFHLAAIIRRLNARAGISVPTTPGPIAGYIDSITATRVIGWAADRAALHEPVILDVVTCRKTIGRIIANIPRPDVAAAGFGRGFHGFEFDIPPNTPGRITVRRVTDGAKLPDVGRVWTAL
jgi:hypothetical protein